MTAVTIKGVVLHDLQPHKDERGQLTEVFRREWVGDDFVQWNLVHTDGNVLRGVHLHHRHADYITILLNRMIIGLKDMRRDSPTFEVENTVELNANAPRGLEIPPGVAHGFYFPEPGSFVYGVSSYFDEDDEMGMMWNDPKLSLFDPGLQPLLSERDQVAGNYEELLALYESRIR